jgi:hypothetical protein
MDMTSHVTPDWGKIASMAQTIALLVTVAGVFMTVGEIKAQIGTNSVSIRELRDVSGDLLKAQVTTTSNDVQYREILNELRRRVDALERQGR